MTTNGNQELFNRALHLIPGGVNSPVRAFGSVGGTPRFIKKAKLAATSTASAKKKHVAAKTKSTVNKP